jgi:hypothetical protein
MNLSKVGFVTERLKVAVLCLWGFFSYGFQVLERQVEMTLWFWRKDAVIVYIPVNF